MFGNMWTWIVLVIVLLAIVAWFKRKTLFSNSAEDEAKIDAVIKSLREDEKTAEESLKEFAQKKEEDFQEFMNSPTTKNIAASLADLPDRNVVAFPKTGEDVTPKPAGITASGNLSYPTASVSTNVEVGDADFVPEKADLDNVKDAVTSATFPQVSTDPVEQGGANPIADYRSVGDDIDALADKPFSEFELTEADLTDKVTPVESKEETDEYVMPVALANNRKITDDDVRAIRANPPKNKAEYDEAAARLGVTRRTLERIVSYDTYINVR